MFPHQTFIRVLSLERNTPRFTITPYSCHCSLAARTFVNNCIQGSNRKRIKFHQKSQTKTRKLTENYNHCHETQLMC